MRLLRRDGDRARVASAPASPARFTIYDDEDQLAIIKAAYKRMGLDEKGHAVPRDALADQPRQEPEEDAAGDVQRVRRSARDASVAAVYEEYEKALRQANALDFDDLLLESRSPAAATTTPRATPGIAA